MKNRAGFLVATSIILLLVPFTSRAAGGFSDDTNWITQLKCSDLVGAADQSPNPTTVPLFSMWARGYMAGISSASNVDLTAFMRTSEFVTAVLVICAQKPGENAVHTAVSVADGIVGLLDSKSKRPPALRDPGTPAPER